MERVRIEAVVQPNGRVVIEGLPVCAFIYSHQDRLLVDMNMRVDKHNELSCGYTAAISTFTGRWR